VHIRRANRSNDRCKENRARSKQLNRMYGAWSKCQNDEMYITQRTQWNNECTKVWATHEKGQEMQRKPEADDLREKKI